MDDNGVTVPYYLYPGDAENALEEEYNWAAQAADDYFPGLVKRVKAVDADRLSDLVAIIEDAKDLEVYAREQLASGAYTYDEAMDKYTLDDEQNLIDRFYEVYGRFSDWLTQYQL